MKSFSKYTLAGAFLLLALATSPRANANDREACSNSTVKGDYAFTISGTILIPNAPPTVIQGIALTKFDGSTDENGNGKLSQIDFVVSNPQLGPPPVGLPKFETQETGTYHINPDCTGRATITFTLSGKVNELILVVSNRGHKIHTVVASLIITDPVSHSPIAVPSVIHSDAERVDPEDSFERGR